MYGDKLKEIQKNNEGLFPLYISLRLGSLRTKIKSITARYWFESEPGNYFTEESRIHYISNNIKSFINADTSYINLARDLHLKAYEKDFEDWSFLQNKMIQNSLNCPINQYFEWKLESDFKAVLLKHNLPKIAEHILPSVGAFTLLYCMSEISSIANLELLSNENIVTLSESELVYMETSLIEFLYKKIPEQSTTLKAIQSELMENTVIALRDNNPLFFSDFVNQK